MSAGENELVAAIVAGLKQQDDVVEGPGDDCAVVRMGDRQLLLKVDSVIEGVHFLSDTDPERVGRKAMARVLSDIGAMGGSPKWALLALAASSDWSDEFIVAVARGAGAIAEAFGVSVVGGETSRVPAGSAAVVSVTMIGEVVGGRALLRSGGRVGDRIYVTGCLGGSFASEWHLDFAPRVRAGQWLAQREEVHAMMDLSDGLASDLPRLARASGVGFEVDLDQLPRRADCSTREAVCDGEDYELLIAAEPGFEGAWAAEFPELQITEIGRLVAGNPVAPEEFDGGGWDPFQKS